MNADGNEHPGPSESDASLDAYIDGRMGEADRAVFQQRLAEDPALADGLAAQRRLDRTLGGLFIVPPFVGLPTNGFPSPQPSAALATASAAATQAAATAAPYNLMLAGLTAVIVTCLAWLVYDNAADPRKSFEEVYREQQTVLSASEGASERCATAEESIFGGRARMKNIPSTITIARMSVEPVLSDQTLVISAKVDGKTVVALIDQMKNVNASSKKKVSEQANGLNVFQREGNGLLLYEMTPFDKPRLLDLYDFPAIPADNAACRVEE